MSKTGECSECGIVKSCIESSDGLVCENCLAPCEPEETKSYTGEDRYLRSLEIVTDTPWYEELKPGTIVVDGRDHPYIAREYRHGMIFDFNDNLIGKTCHLRLATELEAGSLYHE